MGFIMRQAVVLAGSEEFPTGNTDALRVSRSKTLLTKCAQALIDCNVGWQLDTSKSATTTSYTDIPDKSGTKNYPGLFFVNTISGCKLFMAYFGDSIYSYGIKDFSGGDVIPPSGDKNCGGLCISIISGESNQIFGNPTTETFIPSDATRICGTYYRQSSISGEKYPAAYNPESSMYYWYNIMATDSAVCIYSSHTNSGNVGWMACPIYATGKIFGVISHSESFPNAKYGVVLFRVPTSTYEGWATIMTNTVAVYSGTVKVPFGNTSYAGGCFARSDGTWVNGYSNNCNATYFTSDIVLCDRYSTFNITGSYRWSMVGMTVSTTSNLDTLGVTPGNGFKGYLDTSLFRATSATIGKSYFDNGNFISPEEDNSGWILGWDPSNPSIHGYAP